MIGSASPVMQICQQMDSEQHRRKRKHIPRRFPFPTLLSSHYFISIFLLCFCCFVILVFLDSFSTISPSPFRPVLIVSRLPLLSSSALATRNSILRSSADPNDGGPFPFMVEDRVLFHDHVLLLVSKRRTMAKKGLSLPLLHWNTPLNCVYQPLPSSIKTENSTESNELGQENRQITSLPPLSTDEFDSYRLIVRCPTPPSNHSTRVLLQRRGIREFHRSRGNELLVGSLGNGSHHSIHSWEAPLVYGAALDGDTALAFVKGLNLRPDRASDPTQFICHFGWGNWHRKPQFVFTTEALTAAQEVVRCSLPACIRNNPSRANGIRVTIAAASLGTSGRVRTPPRYTPLPSVAKIFDFNTTTTAEKKKFEMCVCTMVWNQAAALREWVAYHAWLGVERWFIYDNNSDDNIKQVIDELDQENYNVSRHVWPWLKTQEAGFSHCVVRAKAECNWVGFIDVDEFFYFPVPSVNRGVQSNSLGYPGRDSLKTLVANFSYSETIGEIRTACHSFGPSGLRTPPPQGVTVGYTCRLQSPERHKSIIRPSALEDTLLNVIHHFRLKTGYTYLNLPQGTAIINHYKYQVWEVFRAKFHRRVATYVADWQENQNEGSKDRAPGLGTEAIEPPNWPLQFCEVWDTGLRDFVMANLDDPENGVLPWGSSVQ